MHAAHALVMKALGEPKCQRCAEMSVLVYAVFQQYDTVKHSAGNEADQSSSSICMLTDDTWHSDGLTKCIDCSR